MLMETIYQKIREEFEEASLPCVKFEDGYPRDHVRLNFDPTEDEERDTVKPLVKALEIITKTIKRHATSEDNIEVTFYHLPGEEEWGICIGDGR